MTSERNAGTGAARRRSAGIMPYRLAAGLQVFLGHMGGPLWARKDLGGWTVVKGEYPVAEDALDAARREWAEETGLPVPDGRWIDLGEVRQSGGKVVRAWAVGADVATGASADHALDDAVSGTFSMQWPPRSGRMQEFPELDRFAWWTPDAAKERIVAAQATFIDRLVAALHDHRLDRA